MTLLFEPNTLQGCKNPCMSLTKTFYRLRRSTAFRFFLGLRLFFHKISSFDLFSFVKMFSSKIIKMFFSNVLKFTLAALAISCGDCDHFSQSIKTGNRLLANKVRFRKQSFVHSVYRFENKVKNDVCAK